MVGRLCRDRPAVLWDVDRYFYGEKRNPCSNRRILMKRYIQFLERVYPRRCCDDDDERVSLGIGRDKPVKHVRDCCQICQEYRESPFIRNLRAASESEEDDPSSEGAEPAQSESQGSRRARRHAKYNGAKIVSRIVDFALQPTHGILAGERGNKLFLRESSRLSREIQVRNCGPGYILWQAMRSVADEVWDQPFEKSEGIQSDYYPSR